MTKEIQGYPFTSEDGTGVTRQASDRFTRLNFTTVVDQHLKTDARIHQPKGQSRR